ncbi:GAF domain-containing protein [Fulvivirgaceae bacterium PWU4]|uniref:GAF domain-containing protein n=1 Tax=Chryseosolibacter histidini TaxID=2782349 RepID=A0AAP2GNB0_9BACT|nr:GAF domain-containing protein [Chryseosolibacter histidini]MBT1696322.1 GAF domain-containing protein [Chryseosolibacter histidini]
MIRIFKNRSLKRSALYLLAGMFFILLGEYVIIRYKIEVLEEVEEKKDYARSAQLAGQQIALLMQEYLSGQQHLATEIASKLDEQDHALKVLGEGGRMDGTDVFLKPLSRLPKITYDQLQESWKKYRGDVLTVILDQSTATTDSAAQVTQADQAKAKMLIPAHWLTLSNWYKRLEIDLTDEADRKKDSVETWVFVFIFSDLILLAGLFYLFNRFVLKPVKRLEQDTLNQHQNFTYPANEIGSLTHEVNEVLEQLKDATDFVVAIGEGKLDFDYKNLDSQYAQGRNKLADSLISMQQKLKDMNVDEQRRQWANEGLTKFVDILRSSNDNISTLGDKIISALVQYTGSNQGGLYILNDEDEHNKYLELISLFAFDNKKFNKQKIRLGEGILGQTFLEKETTLLTEIPEEYIRITSGLGDANPNALVMVPLKVDKQVYGIVELASFKAYQQHEIAFVEKLAETIASTLASVKAAQKNRDLIGQFQMQAEQMKAQEEEMRQNMEELQATQEEMARKERDYISRIQDLERNQSRPGEVEELQRIKGELTQKEHHYTQQLRDLESKLAQKPAKTGDWALAEEVEKTLRFQLEALRIAQEEFPGK